MLQNVTFTQQIVSCMASCCPRCAEAVGWLCQLPFRLYGFVSVRRWARAMVLVALLLFYCEFVHYFVVLLQCSWPQLTRSDLPEQLGGSKEHRPLKVMVIADLHLLGWREGHWFDKLRRWGFLFTVTKFCMQCNLAFIQEQNWRCSFLLWVFVHCAMGHRIDLSWWTHLAVSHSSQCSTTGVQSCLWDGAYKRSVNHWMITQTSS